MRLRFAIRYLTVALVAMASLSIALAQLASVSGMKKWQQGKGWGWVWGADDEVGSLNEMTDASRLTALRIARSGQVFDLGVLYDRNSFKWPGHSPGEIITFRSPENVKRQNDFAAAKSDPRGTAWHSCSLFMSDNVGTQIDSLCHAVEGADNHWYNGFKAADWGGNFGPRKCDASTIPPIIARGVMIDVAGYQGLRVLPPHAQITAKDLQGALQKQQLELRPGDVVLIRTGSSQFWSSGDSKMREQLTAHDSAGILLDAAKWLVEEKGAMLIGSDTSGLEYAPSAQDAAAYQQRMGSFMPVHNYLLIEQGIHIGELHNLEELAKERVYEFCYMCTTANIRGTTAGFALRPLAIR